MHKAPVSSTMQLFHLHRDHDVTGKSGTGRIAEGFALSDGRAAITWLTTTPSVTLHQSLDAVRQIHGHHGTTQVVFFTQEDFLTLQYPRPLTLFHESDPYGLTGTGKVAEGCWFSNNWIILHWLVFPNGVEFFPKYEDFYKLQGDKPYGRLEVG